ncbi:MAG: DUF3102 domain-containing protein [Pirellulales bacterium]
MSENVETGLPAEPKSAEDRLAELVDKIKEGHKKCHQALRRSVEFARDTGNALINAKEIVPNKSWGTWVAENCGFSLSQAQRYMRIANNWAEVIKSDADLAKLTMVQALKLLSPRKGKEPGETSTKPSVAKAQRPKVSQEEFQKHFSIATEVTLVAASPAMEFVKRQAEQLAGQILRLVNGKEKVTDEDGREMETSVAALAILYQLRKALANSCVVEIEKSANDIVDTASQSGEVAKEVHRHEGNGHPVMA